MPALGAGVLSDVVVLPFILKQLHHRLIDTSLDSLTYSFVSIVGSYFVTYNSLAAVTTIVIP